MTETPIDGFADVLTTTFPTAKAVEERRNEAYEGMVRLIGRAKATGRLREDFDPSDLVLIHMANAGVVNATGEAAPDALYQAMPRNTPAGVAGSEPEPEKGS
jgi:hypothetical protein